MDPVSAGRAPLEEVSWMPCAARTQMHLAPEAADGGRAALVAGVAAGTGVRVPIQRERR